jgi:hypothetical protein
VAVTKQSSLTLLPQAVTLLDAMAQVVGIPYKLGEATIDLRPFTRPNSTPPSPTLENKSITAL